LNRAETRALGRDIAKQIAAGGVDLAPAAQRRVPIFLGYCAGATVHTAWVSSLLACAARSPALGLALRPRLCESGPMIQKARNLLLRAFLETEDEYLLFVDTDIVFSAEDIKLLLEADAPIAGALYFTAATGMEPWPVALERRDEEAEPGVEVSDGKSDTRAPGLVPITLPEPPEDLLAGKLREDATAEEVAAADAQDAKLLEWLETETQPRRVDAVGAGLMLVRRDVAAALAEAHDGRPFAYVDDIGEDVTFCLRAAELGFETILVPAARVGHVKAVVL